MLAEMRQALRPGAPWVDRTRLVPSGEQLCHDLLGTPLRHRFCQIPARQQGGTSWAACTGIPTETWQVWVREILIAKLHRVKTLAPHEF